MCARLRPMEVVSVLNAMYVAFDHLCEVHHVYKVSSTIRKNFDRLACKFLIKIHAIMI